MTTPQEQQNKEEDGYDTKHCPNCNLDFLGIGMDSECPECETKFQNKEEIKYCNKCRKDTGEDGRVYISKDNKPVYRCFNGICNMGNYKCPKCFGWTKKDSGSIEVNIQGKCVNCGMQIQNKGEDWNYNVKPIMERLKVPPPPQQEEKSEQKYATIPKNEFECCDKCYFFKERGGFCSSPTCACHDPKYNHNLSSPPPQNTRGEECKNCGRISAIVSLKNNCPFCVGKQNIVDLDAINPLKLEFATEFKSGWTIEQIADFWLSKFSAYKDSLIEEVGKMEMPKENTYPVEARDCVVYNQAIEDILNVIRKKQ